MMSAASMIRSRFALNCKKIKPILNGSIRREGHAVNHSGIYRMEAPTAYYGPNIRVMKFLQICFWWHVFYSFWYDPEKVLGHPSYQFPNPELWTDEDLGIPPDDYDEVV